MQKIFKISINLLLICVVYCEQSAPVINEACEDFYEFACANYSQENPDSNYNEIMGKLDYEINKKLLMHLQEFYKQNLYEGGYQRYYDKLGIYFEACYKDNNANLKNYLLEVKPGINLDWPLMINKSEWLKVKQHYDLWSLLGQLQSYGLNNVLIKHQITSNEDNTLNIHLKPAVVAEMDDLPQEALIYILKALNINATKTVIKNLINYKIEQHKKLESFTKTNTTKMIFIYENLPTQFQRYLQSLLGYELHKLKYITIQQPTYFDDLFQNSRSTVRNTNVFNYLMLEFISFVAKDKTKAFTPFACIKDLRKNFDLAMNYITFKSFFEQQGIQFIIVIPELVNKLKLVMEFLFNINFLNLSNEQTDYLKTKLKDLKVNVGNMPPNINHEFLEEYYSTIPALNAADYYKNHLLLLEYRFKNSLKSLKTLSFYINNDHSTGVLSSPFYVPRQNMVVIPWSSLQPPLFNGHNTMLENLSLFGFVLAHEFGHAFDLTGLNYDSQGYLLPYTSYIVSHFNSTKSLDCFESDVESQKINERFADLFAIRVVHAIYFHFYAEKENYDETKFFLNLAQFFCNKINLPSKTHDADNVRLQFAVKNYAPFAKAFGCKEDRPMNPKKKCRIY